jgi:hypothetical protein
MNPYAVYLGERNAMEVIEATPRRLAALVEVLGKTGCERRPAPGKWCAREILCHLADTELVFAFRLRQALAEPYHVIQPYDQERWAEQYGAYDTAAALEVFRAVREWNVKLIRTVGEAEMAKLLTHPERGEMAFRVVVETMGGHDLNHLGQMAAIAGG